MPSAVNSLRNVELDPGADAHLVDVDVGELDRQPAAAVEVDHREHHRRARRVGEPVDGEGGDGAGGVGHRDGGGIAGLRRQVHLAVVVRRADEAELPVARAAGGRRRRAGRLGPARRLDRQQAAPAQVGAVGDRRAGRRPGRRRGGPGVHDGERVGGAEQQRRRRRRPARRARSPGRASAASSAAVSSEGGLGGAGVADGGRRGRPTSRSPTPSFLASAGVGPGVGAGDDDVVDLVGHQPGRLQRVVPRRLARAARSGSRRSAPPTPSSGRRPACATGRGTPRWPGRRR